MRLWDLTRSPFAPDGAFGELRTRLPRKLKGRAFAVTYRTAYIAHSRSGNPLRPHAGPNLSLSRVISG
jgi:hypothetical protein